MGLPDMKKRKMQPVTSQLSKQDTEHVERLAELLGCNYSLGAAVQALTIRREELNIVRQALGLLSTSALTVHEVHSAVNRLKDAARLEETIQAVIDKNVFTRCDLQITVGRTPGGYEAVLSAREKKPQQARGAFPFEMLMQQEPKVAMLDLYNGTTLVAAVAGLKR